MAEVKLDLHNVCSACHLGVRYNQDQLERLCKGGRNFRPVFKKDPRKVGQSVLSVFFPLNTAAPAGAPHRVDSAAQVLCTPIPERQDGADGCGERDAQ